MSGAGNRDTGFTLLEMLVAIGVMALVSGIAFPLLERRALRGGQQAAQLAIVLALANARADAIGHGVPTRLWLAGDGFLRSSSGRMPVAMPDSAGVVWPDSGYVFFADGSAMGGWGGVRTASGVTRFTVDPGTGRPVFVS